jgi:hypothetical protein
MPLHAHHSDPIIIDNPAASFPLLPRDHEQYLVPIAPPSNHNWAITGRSPFSRIEIKENANRVLMHSLDTGRPVVIAFQMVNHPANPARRPAGSVTITWNSAQQMVEFRASPVGGFAAFLRWRKTDQLPGTAPVGLIAEPIQNPQTFTPDYRITSVTYYQSGQAVPTPFSPSAAGNSITVALLA